MARQQYKLYFTPKGGKYAEAKDDAQRRAAAFSSAILMVLGLDWEAAETTAVDKGSYKALHSWVSKAAKRHGNVELLLVPFVSKVEESRPVDAAEELVKLGHPDYVDNRGNCFYHSLFHSVSSKGMLDAVADALEISPEIDVTTRQAFTRAVRGLFAIPSTKVHKHYKRQIHGLLNLDHGTQNAIVTPAEYGEKFNYIFYNCRKLSDAVNPLECITESYAKEISKKTSHPVYAMHLELHSISRVLKKVLGMEIVVITPQSNVRPLSDDNKLYVWLESVHYNAYVTRRYLTSLMSGGGGGGRKNKNTTFSKTGGRVRCADGIDRVAYRRGKGAATYVRMKMVRGSGYKYQKVLKSHLS